MTRVWDSSSEVGVIGDGKGFRGGRGNVSNQKGRGLLPADILRGPRTLNFNKKKGGKDSWSNKDSRSDGPVTSGLNDRGSQRNSYT